QRDVARNGIGRCRSQLRLGPRQPARGFGLPWSVGFSLSRVEEAIMRTKYVIVSGAIFGLIAVIQAVRAINGWPIQVAGFQVPVLASWVAAALAASMCLWAFKSKG